MEGIKKEVPLTKEVPPPGKASGGWDGYKPNAGSGNEGRSPSSDVQLREGFVKGALQRLEQLDREGSSQGDTKGKVSEKMEMTSRGKWYKRQCEMLDNRENEINEKNEKICEEMEISLKEMENGEASKEKIQKMLQRNNEINAEEEQLNQDREYLYNIEVAHRRIADKGYPLIRVGFDSTSTRQKVSGPFSIDNNTEGALKEIGVIVKKSNDGYNTILSCNIKKGNLQEMNIMLEKIADILPDKNLYTYGRSRREGQPQHTQKYT